MSIGEPPIYSLNSTSQTNSSQIDPECKILFLYEDQEFIFTTRICLYICLILVISRVLGNAINVDVILKTMKKHSSSVFILLLAVSDSTYLISSLLLHYLTECFHFTHFHLDITNHSSFLCKLLFYLWNLSFDYSSTLILFFTVHPTGTSINFTFCEKIRKF